MSVIIQWDLDGVLANFNQGYRRLCNQMFNLNVDVNEEPAFWDDLPEGMDEEKDKRVWNHIVNSANFWYELEPLATYTELQRIARLDAVQYFVTSRPGKTAKAQSEDWVTRHIFSGDAGFTTVIVSNRKSEAANALKANFVIDDKAGNVVQLYYNTKACVYCLDAPYNQFDQRVIGRGVHRVKTVTEFLNEVERA